MNRQSFLKTLGTITAAIFFGSLFMVNGHRHAARSSSDRAYTAAPPDPVSPVDRVSQRLLALSPKQDGVTFDPITISIVASILCSILRYCAASSATRLQSAVKRRPKGSAATRLRGRLREQYGLARARDGFLFDDLDQINQHVDATMTAFAEATPAEVRKLVADSQLEEPSALFISQPMTAAKDMEGIE